MVCLTCVNKILGIYAACCSALDVKLQLLGQLAWHLPATLAHSLMSMLLAIVIQTFVRFVPPRCASVCLHGRYKDLRHPNLCKRMSS